MKITESNRVVGWLGNYKQNNFLKRFSTVLIIDIIARGSSILLLPLYLRLMTQEEFGIYSYIISIITTFSVILNFGLYVSQSKYYSDADTEEKRKKVLFNIMIVLTTLLLLIVLPVYGFNLDYPIIKSLFKNDINYSLYRLPILLALIVAVYTVILTNFFITSEKIKHFRWYNLIRLFSVHIVVLSSMFIFNQEDKIGIRLLYTYLVELVIMLTFMFFYLRSMTPIVDYSIIRKALKLGLPVMLAAIWAMFSTSSDKFFLEKYGNHRDLSCYYLAFSLSNVVTMVCTAVQNAWMPTFLKEKDLRMNIVNTRKLLTRLSIGLLAITALVVFAFFCALQLNVIKQDYLLTMGILPILMVAQIINGVLMIYSNYFIYLEKTHWSLFVGIFTSIIGFTGSYLLIDVWGIWGAAIVYLAVQLAYWAIYYRIIETKLRAKLVAAPATNDLHHQLRE